MGRNTAGKKIVIKTTKIFCSAKNIYNVKCSANLIRVRLKIASRLKSLGVKTEEDSRICTTCGINISKQKLDGSKSEQSDEIESMSLSDQYWLDEYVVLITLLKKKICAN